MASPFSGMDPFLEGPEWPDFHSRFVNAWCAAIADELPEDYVARLDERVYLIEPDPEVRKLIKPDIAISKTEREAATRSSTGVATLEPVTLPLEIIGGVTEVFIEILKKPDLSL